MLNHSKLWQTIPNYDKPYQMVTNHTKLWQTIPNYDKPYQITYVQPYNQYDKKVQKLLQNHAKLWETRRFLDWMYILMQYKYIMPEQWANYSTLDSKPHKTFQKKQIVPNSAKSWQTIYQLKKTILNHERQYIRNYKILYNQLQNLILNITNLKNPLKPS